MNKIYNIRQKQFGVQIANRCILALDIQILEAVLEYKPDILKIDGNSN